MIFTNFQNWYREHKGTLPTAPKAAAKAGWRAREKEVKQLQVRLKKLLEKEMTEGKKYLVSLGEYRVGVDFNPHDRVDVGTLKDAQAKFIDAVGELTYTSTNPEVKRLAGLAMERAEEAAMYAVKAVTKPPVP